MTKSPTHRSSDLSAAADTRGLLPELGQLADVSGVVAGDWVLLTRPGRRLQEWHQVTRITHRGTSTGLHFDGGGFWWRLRPENVLRRLHVKPEATPQATQMARQVLAELFPQTKFRVVPVGGCPQVSWQDGPTPAAVTAALANAGVYRRTVHRSRSAEAMGTAVVRGQLEGSSYSESRYLALLEDGAHATPVERLFGETLAKICDGTLHRMRYMLDELGIEGLAALHDTAVPDAGEPRCLRCWKPADFWLRLEWQSNQMPCCTECLGEQDNDSEVIPLR